MDLRLPQLPAMMFFAEAPGEKPKEKREPCLLPDIT